MFNRWDLVLGRLLHLFQQSLDARDESLRGVICPLPLGESLKRVKHPFNGLFIRTTRPNIIGEFIEAILSFCLHQLVPPTFQT
jgi:hypothetical protein